MSQKRQQTHSIRQLCFFLPIAVEDNLQQSCTTDQRRRVLLDAKRVEKPLSNPDTLEYISLNAERGSENLANFLRSGLSDLLVAVGQKWIIFRIKLLLGHPVFYLSLDFLRHRSASFATHTNKSCTIRFE